MGSNRDEERAKRILDWIASRGLRDFTRRECQRELRQFRTSAELAGPLQILTERGYVRRAEPDTTGKKGRSEERYQVNPALFGTPVGAHHHHSAHQDEDRGDAATTAVVDAAESGAGADDDDRSEEVIDL